MDRGRVWLPCALCSSHSIALVRGRGTRRGQTPMPRTWCWQTAPPPAVAACLVARGPASSSSPHAGKGVLLGLPSLLLPPTLLRGAHSDAQRSPSRPAPPAAARTTPDGGTRVPARPSRGNPGPTRLHAQDQAFRVRAAGLSTFQQATTRAGPRESRTSCFCSRSPVPRRARRRGHRGKGAQRWHPCSRGASLTNHFFQRRFCTV